MKTNKQTNKGRKKEREREKESGKERKKEHIFIFLLKSICRPLHHLQNFKDSESFHFLLCCNEICQNTGVICCGLWHNLRQRYHVAGKRVQFSLAFCVQFFSLVDMKGQRVRIGICTFLEKKNRILGQCICWLHLALRIPSSLGKIFFQLVTLSARNKTYDFLHGYQSRCSTTELQETVRAQATKLGS